MASSLQAAIKKAHPKSEIELIESGGGVFEVKKDGRLIFSKKKEGRFPSEEEILKQLR